MQLQSFHIRLMQILINGTDAALEIESRIMIF